MTPFCWPMACGSAKGCSWSISCATCRRTCATDAAICRRSGWRAPGLKPEDLLQPANEPRLRPLYHGVSRPCRSPPAGGLGLHQRLAAPLRARAAGLRVADSDWPRDPQPPARRQRARPGAAHQSQPARGPAAHTAVDPALSLAGSVGKNGSRRESYCFGCPFDVIKPSCRFQNSSCSPARCLAPPSSRCVRPSPLPNRRPHPSPSRLAIRRALPRRVRPCGRR